jgi:hypothetical protein
MRKLLIAATLIISLVSCKNKSVMQSNVERHFKSDISNIKVCPDCEETNCIYQQINDSVKGEGTDQNIMDAVQKVTTLRGIKDSTTIKLILSNYYL